MIWGILYEPLTESVREKLMEDVSRIIAEDPRVDARNIIIEEKGYGIQVLLELEFSAYNHIETMVLKFDRDSGLSSR